jgi:hypothetical protein
MATMAAMRRAGFRTARAGEVVRMPLVSGEGEVLVHGATLRRIACSARFKAAIVPTAKSLELLRL